jgi:hypothetical protein
VHTVAVPWTLPPSHPIPDLLSCFERFAIDILLATQVQGKTAALLRLTTSQIHDLMARAVERGLAPA